MKKKVICIIVIIVCVLATGIGYKVWLSLTPGSEIPYAQEVTYLNDKVDFKLLLYGEEIVFPENLEYTTVDEISEKTVDNTADYIYFVVNDLNGSVDFSKEDFLFLKKYADENLNFNFYYIGTESLQMIQENIENCNLNDGDMSFGYIVYEGERMIHYGMWSTNDHQYLEMNETLLGENICCEIQKIIKTNE